MAHGNSKHETEFKRTMPSVIDKMKSEEGGAKKVYRKMVCTDPKTPHLCAEICEDHLSSTYTGRTSNHLHFHCVLQKYHPLSASLVVK
jgi:hypothetical protein